MGFSCTYSGFYVCWRSFFSLLFLLLATEFAQAQVVIPDSGYVTIKLSGGRKVSGSIVSLDKDFLRLLVDSALVDFPRTVVVEVVPDLAPWQERPRRNPWSNRYLVGNSGLAGSNKWYLQSTYIYLNSISFAPIPAVEFTAGFSPPADWIRPEFWGKMRLYLAEPDGVSLGAGLFVTSADETIIADVGLTVGNESSHSTIGGAVYASSSNETIPFLKYGISHSIAERSYFVFELFTPVVQTWTDAASFEGVRFINRKGNAFTLYLVSFVDFSESEIVAFPVIDLKIGF